MQNPSVSDIIAGIVLHDLISIYTLHVIRVLSVMAEVTFSEAILSKNSPVFKTEDGDSFCKVKWVASES